jgi:hypothetical protein
MLFFLKHYGNAWAAVLRSTLAVLTVGKLLVWCAAWMLPPLRVRATRELGSNVDVLRLCWRLD